MDVIRLLLITTLATIIPGQAIRIPFVEYGALTLTDITVATTVIFFLVYTLIFRRLFFLPKKMAFSAFTFLAAALASTIFAVNNFALKDVLVSSFFLLRFIFYLLFIVVTVNAVKNKIDQWLNVILFVGTIFALIGILQVILIPNLSFLTIYGWDPHVNRLVSSLIDPNFSGGLLTSFLAISLALYLYKKNIFYLVISFLFFASIILTFSRSSYLALLTTVLIIGLVKSPRIIFVTFLLFVFVLLGSQKAQSRVSGAFALDETAYARIESWKNALSMFVKNPVLGVGFNTYRFAQEKYGNFSFDNPQGGHSGAGSDSSTLLVAATTGIIGFISFALLILSIVKLITKNIKSDYLSLGVSSGFFAVLVHSQFVNSLFYPQIMVIIWFLVGLKYAKDN